MMIPAQLASMTMVADERQKIMVLSSVIRLVRALNWVIILLIPEYCKPGIPT